MSKIVISSVTNMLYSKWSTASSAERVSQVERAFRIQVVVNIIILLGVFIFGKWAVIILYGRPFLPAVTLMYILVISEIFRSTTALHTSLYAGDGKPLLTALVFGICIPVVVIMMLILTPRFGITGAAWAQTLSSLTGLSLATIISIRLYGVNLKSSLLLNKSDIHYIRQSLLHRSS
jgi:O-antigen/teichoic acid export membrane protein